MPTIPRDENFDSTLALLADPYEFIAKRCRRYGSDLFETRLLLRRTVCMSGPQAAELFCNPARFTREDAAPRRVRKTLFGEGGVQGLDGEAHQHRKRMFMSLMTEERIGELASLTATLWRECAQAWAGRDHIVLYDEAREILTRAVCAWAGVPLAEREVGLRTDQFTAMYQHAGALGMQHWRARRARRATERWIEALIAGVRAGRLAAPPESAARVIGLHRDHGRELLPPRVAAVELINVLRPTVAVSVYIAQAAHALHQHPECRERLLHERDYAALFVQEVRRFYPFFPAVMARVRADFEWRGYRFHEGRQALLDLYGTNHDARTWRAPDTFRPERFRDWDGSAFKFIPQGPGDPHRHHRCPGEWIAMEVTKVALEFLLREVRFDVPPQHLALDKSRLPALPRSGFVIRNVRVA